MITIYKTDTMKDAAEYVLGVLKKIDKTNLSVMHTVIVPDRASLEAERALLRAVGGSFNIQVKTFRRLANDILPKYEYLSKQAGIMALEGIIRDSKDKLCCYKKGVETAGFVADMYDTISMMKYCKIRPDDLLNGDLSRSVKGKAHDISLLYRAYTDFCADRFVDSADKLDLLRLSLADSETATKGEFYLYDFDNFSAQEFALVEELMRVSKGVTVACCASSKPADRYLYLNDIYNGLIDLCKRNGIVPHVEEGKSRPSVCVKQIGDNLYRYGEVKPVPADGFVEVFRGATRANEVYALACKIQNYVRSGGRFRDVYVVTSDINCYFNAVTLTFNEFEIPYFCDRQYALSAHPYARFVLDYLLLQRNGGKLSYVLPFVKNYLFCGSDDGLSADGGVYRFENYCLKYNVSYRYDRFDLGKNEPYFDSADKFRAKFNAVYRDSKFPHFASVSEYVALVRALIDKVGLSERNGKFAKKQEEEGLKFEARITEQAAEKFDGVLLQAENVLGGRVVSLDEFIKTLTAGVEAVKISVLPVTNDCVVFANMAKARKHDVKFLALLGANYGAMPIVKSDCKLLSDSNIKSLVGAGINVEPQIFVENKRERFSLLQLLQEPSDKLYVSYAEADGANALVPSPFVNELFELFTDRGASLAPSDDADEDVYTEEQAISKIVLNERKLKDKQLVKMPAYTVLKKEFAQKTDSYKPTKEGRTISVERGAELYLKNSATSVSQLTDFFKCPYCFYIQYGLNVKPRSVSELQTADLGNILHAVLENYVRSIQPDETDAETEEKAANCFEDALSDDFYRGLRSDPQMAGTLEQLLTESKRMCVVVKKQLAASEFVNLATEMAFGGSSGVAPVVVDFDGGQFSLVGKIDRVDVFGDRFIVIDYKSGAVAAHYSEKDLYVGHKLQLPVYVKAVRDLYNKRPAGFYYFNMHNNFTEMGEDKVYVYNGRTLDDVDIACAIDGNLKNGSSEKLKLKLKKDGGLSRQSKSLLTDEQFDNQIEYAFLLIRKAGDLMQKGYAAVNPYEGVCSYCDYKDICDFGDVYSYDARNVVDRIGIATIDKTVKK